ncbi:MAG: hypothetical protein KAW09_00555 [Thermoplasmata archaeon]|nr:hypothetical protein [Thermoplasmata archaeon]
MNLLRDAGLVESKRDKNWVINNLTEEGEEIAGRFNL